MKPVTPALLFEWAVGCNLRSAGGPVGWLPGGQMRLRRLALGYSQLFALSCNEQVQTWEQYLDDLARLAVSLPDGVFRAAGPETARDLVLCVLGNAGFRLRSGEPPVEADLLGPIRARDSRRLADLLKLRYRDPVDE
jgi:hypothetical protein